MVCQARAFAQRTREVPGFDDPTAMALLPADARAEVEQHLASPSRRFAHVSLVKRGAMMVARTIAIDDGRPRSRSASSRDLGRRARRAVWVWEGVVMYLALPDIERTLQIVQRRSAPGSRLAILYHCRGWILSFVKLFVRMVGEPIRSVVEEDEMRALLARFGSKWFGTTGCRPSPRGSPTIWPRTPGPWDTCGSSPRSVSSESETPTRPLRIDERRTPSLVRHARDDATRG
jgi:hypothetical protein